MLNPGGRCRAQASETRHPPTRCSGEYWAEARDEAGVGLEPGRNWLMTLKCGIEVTEPRKRARYKLSTILRFSFREQERFIFKS